MLFDLAVFHQFNFFGGHFFEEFGGRSVVRVLRDEFAHNGELQDGLFELVDAPFGGEEGIEVFGDSCPGDGEAIALAGRGQCVEQGLHQGLMGVDAAFLLLFQLVAEGHELVDFDDDSLLFCKRWQNYRQLIRLFSA